MFYFEASLRTWGIWVLEKEVLAGFLKRECVLCVGTGTPYPSEACVFQFSFFFFLPPHFPLALVLSSSGEQGAWDGTSHVMMVVGRFVSDLPTFPPMHVSPCTYLVSGLVGTATRIGREKSRNIRIVLVIMFLDIGRLFASPLTMAFVGAEMGERHVGRQPRHEMRVVLEHLCDAAARAAGGPAVHMQV